MYADSTIAVMAHVLQHGPSSRAELARELGLSPASLSRLVRPLMDDGLMRDDHTGVSSSGMGRPTQLLDVAVDEHLFAGVSIAHGALSGVLTNARAQVVVERTCPLTRRDPAHVGESMVLLVGELVEANGPDPAGERRVRPSRGRLQSLTICAPDELLNSHPRQRAFPDTQHGRAATGVSAPGAPGAEGLDPGTMEEAILASMRDRLSITPRIMEETDAVLLLEQWFGAGVEAESFAMVTVGEHVGSQFVTAAGTSALLPGVAGQQRTPSSRLAAARRLAATSHLAIAGAVGICQFGHVGCATGALSNSAVLGRARSGRVLIGDSERRPFNLTDLMYLADIGDEPSRRALAEYGANLAMFVTMIGRATAVSDVILDGDGLVMLSNHRALESFSEALGRFNVPGIPRLNVVNRFEDAVRKARGAATAGIVNWLAGVSQP